MIEGTLIDDLLAESVKVEKQLRDNLSILAGRDDLNDKGVADSRGMFEGHYKTAVGELQQRATARLEAERAKLALALKAARAKAFETKRSILGDQVVARIIEKSLEGLPAEEIAKAFEEASDGFEKTLVGELGRVILRDLAEREPSTATFLALQKLAEVSPDLVELQQKEHILRHSEELVAELDPVAWRADVGGRLGIKAEFMTPTSRGEWE